MKIIPITLTMEQLKELCEMKMTDLYFKEGATIVRIIVKMPKANAKSS